MASIVRTISNDPQALSDAAAALSQGDQETASAAMQDSPFPSRRYTWLLRGLSMVALGVSGYLAIKALRSEQVFGCSGDVWDCGHVLSSRWSKVFGLPVGVPAAGLYAGLLGALTLCTPTSRVGLQSLGWFAVSIAAFAAGSAALWFVGLQIFTLGHLCVYCIIAHACGLILLGAVVWRRPLGTRLTLSMAGFGLSATGVLVAAQILDPPQTFQVIEEPSVPGTAVPGDDTDDQPTDEPTDEIDDSEIFEPFGLHSPLHKMRTYATMQRSTSASLTSIGPLGALLATSLFFTGAEPTTAFAQDSSDQQSGEQKSEDTKSQEAAPERRIISISGGKTKLDVRQWPLLGDPNARYVFVEMFDYTCPHCRATHRSIDGAMKRYGNDLAVIALPVPLDRACNSAVRSTNSQHRHACKLAVIAVAVWRVNPAKFRQFHGWLFDSSNRTPSAAEREAARLVGADALKKELGEPWARKYVAKHVELYQRHGAGTVPKLLFPKSTVVGEVGSTSSLVNLVERQLGSR